VFFYATDFASKDQGQDWSQDWILSQESIYFEPQRNPRILRNPELDKTIKTTKNNKN